MAFVDLSEKNAKMSGRRILDLLIEFVSLTIVFLVPLWFAYLFPTYNIFEFNKMIVFRILVWLLFFFTIAKIIFYPPRFDFAPRFFLKKYWLAPLIFILGLSLTLTFSTDAVRSFYGAIERQAGVSSYLFYFLWFVLVSFNLLTVDNRRGRNKLSDQTQNQIQNQVQNQAQAQTQNQTNDRTYNQAYNQTCNYTQAPTSANRIVKNIRRLIIAAVISGSLVSLYGILQILNIDFIVWPEPASLTHRVFSSFGQPNFLASWLLLVAPLSFYLLYTSRQFLIKFAFLLAGFAQLLCLLLTGSRGALAAAALVAIIFLTRFLLTAASSRRKKYSIIFGFLVLATGTLLLLNRLSPERVQKAFNTNFGSTGARANFYLAAGDAIKERPFFGYGPETSGEIFIRYYRPDWAVFGDVGQSTDRAHNLILDILLTTGFYGLILFTILYYFFFALGRKNLRQGREPFLVLALLIGAAAYLLSLLFSFTIVAGEIYFWLFLAILVALNFSGSSFGTNPDFDVKAASPASFLSASSTAVSSPALPSSASADRSATWRPLKLLALAVLGVAVFVQINYVFRTLIADYYFNKVYYTLATREYFTVLTLDGYLRSQKTNAVNQEAYDIFLAEKLSNFYPTIDELAAKGAVAAKLTALDRALAPRGYKNILAKAQLNNALGNFSAADIYLTRVTAITPYWPLVYLEAGKAAIAQGDNRKAIVAYLMAALNLPAANDARLNQPHRELVNYYYYFIDHKIASLFIQEKNYPAATKYYKLAYQYNPNDFTLLKKIADTYYYRGDLASAIQYNLHGLTRDPDDYQWSVALAVLYYESGNQESALKYLRQALARSPNNEDLKNLLLNYERQDR